MKMIGSTSFLNVLYDYKWDGQYWQGHGMHADAMTQCKVCKGLVTTCLQCFACSVWPFEETCIGRLRKTDTDTNICNVAKINTYAR